MVVGMGMGLGLGRVGGGECDVLSFGVWENRERVCMRD